MAAVTYTVQIDWNNDGSVAAGSPTTNEDVTANVLAVRTPLSWTFGRDDARSLSAIKPGELTIELKNTSKLYSPDFAAGALFGNLGPGKPVLVKAVHNAITYNLFWGYIDSFDLTPGPKAEASVVLGVQDVLGRLAEQNVTTTLYQSIQTGDAIDAVLDAAGWSGSLRDISSGATTIRWFWADSEPALNVINDIVASEGPHALAYVDPSGNFVFRDRHHRFLKTASTSSQATFRDTGAESSTDVNFSAPATYDVGFADLANDVSFDVEERDPTDFVAVWSIEDKFRIAASGSVTFNASTEDPFFGAITPVLGVDYTVDSGSVASVSLSQTAGGSTVVTVTAGGSVTVVTGMAVRAYTVPVKRSYTVTASDATSQGKYGIKSWNEDLPKWVSKNDAEVIADFIIGQRKDRLPVFQVSITQSSDNRKVQSLARKLSDMVTIVEANSGSSGTYWIEQIGYDIPGSRGQVTQYGCEKSRNQDDPTTIFILDSGTVNHRLDSGKLAT